MINTIPAGYSISKTKVCKMIAMNIRKHISRRRHSERDMSLRHKRLLSLEISRKISLQDMATKNIDKEMGNIQKKLSEMRNPSRSWQQKKQYKFPVPSPVWKRWKPPRSACGKTPRREVLLLKSFDDNDDNDDDDDDDDDDEDEDSAAHRDSYRRWSTSETLLIFNQDDQNENEKNDFLNRKELQPVISEESALSSKTNDDFFTNPNLVLSRLNNKTESHTPSKQTVGLSPDPSWQSNVTGKPLVVFSPEKISSFYAQFVQGNGAAARNAKETGNNLQPVAEKGTLLPLPPIQHNGAAAAVEIELPEQSLSPTRTLGLRSTADVPVYLPAAIAQEGQLHQQLSSHLQNNLMVGYRVETGKETREKILCHRNDASTQADPSDNNENNNSNNQQGSLFAGVPDFATLARTSMSSIKKDIARRLSTTAVPAELNKLQWQRNSEAVPKNKFKRHSIYSDSSLGENTLPSSGVGQLLLPKKYEGNDSRRRSEEGGHHLGATASFRRLSLNTSRERSQRQEASTEVVTSKTPDSDSSGLRIISKQRAEEKPRRKSYLKSLPTYDRELYNPDGSLRTVYCLPSFDECWEQAQQARYIRTRETMTRDKELSVDEVFAKRTNKDGGVEESTTDK